MFPSRRTKVGKENGQLQIDANTKSEHDLASVLQRQRAINRQIGR